MKFKKILVMGVNESALDSEYWKRIRLLTDKIIFLPKDVQEIKSYLEDTDCLLVGFGIKIDKNIIDSAPNLKYIGVLATAYDKVDVEYAKQKRILVCNIPGYSTEAVAEFVLSVLLEHMRELERAKRQAREGNYSEAGFLAIEIKNKIFGVLGLGRIGSRVAEIALGFGADVRYWSRNRKKELEIKGIKYEDADSLIPKCDFLSLHLALTKYTENFLNEERIQKIKKGAIIINTAPMELIDINTLENRLERGDVTFIFDHSDAIDQQCLKKLFKYKNCIVYPPIAYVSKEARIAKQEIFVENIEGFLRGLPANKVN
jgi:lactate dehydrogenase-like 2-hydroxyacid dehydrogenase